MSATMSPITGVIDEVLVIVDFGKHEGKTIQEISESDPSFYDLLKTEKEKGTFAIRRHKDKTFRLYINPLAKFDQ